MMLFVLGNSGDKDTSSRFRSSPSSSQQRVGAQIPSSPKNDSGFPPTSRGHKLGHANHKLGHANQILLRLTEAHLQ
jgi:hypothetical protein